MTKEQSLAILNNVIDIMKSMTEEELYDYMYKNSDAFKKFANGVFQHKADKLGILNDISNVSPSLASDVIRAVTEIDESILLENPKT